MHVWESDYEYLSTHIQTYKQRDALLSFISIQIHVFPRDIFLVQMAEGRGTIICDKPNRDSKESCLCH